MRRFKVVELLVVVGIVAAIGMVGVVPFLQSQQQQVRDTMVQRNVRTAGTLLETGGSGSGVGWFGGGSGSAGGDDALQLLREVGYEAPPEIDLGSAEVEVAGTCVSLRHRDGGDHWRYSRGDAGVVVGRCDEIGEVTRRK